MDEIEESLINAGLSKIEVDSYLAILKNAPISAGKVAKLTHNYRANVYQAIERLKSKGFVSESHGKRSKQFEALSPEHILEDINKKYDSVKKIIPILNEIKSLSISPTKMRVIEGLNGWRHLLNEFLESGKERVVYGIPIDGIRNMGDFFKEYHKRREQKKVWLRHLFNNDAKCRVKITNKIPYTQSKYLPKELNQPVSTSVCGPIVALTIYKEPVLTFVIENQIIADAYRKYFEYLWKLAKH